MTSRASRMGSCPPASLRGKCTLYRLVRPCCRPSEPLDAASSSRSIPVFPMMGPARPAPQPSISTSGRMRSLRRGEGVMVGDRLTRVGHRSVQMTSCRSPLRALTTKIMLGSSKSQRAAVVNILATGAVPRTAAGADAWTSGGHGAPTLAGGHLGNLSCTEDGRTDLPRARQDRRLAHKTCLCRRTSTSAGPVIAAEERKALATRRPTISRHAKTRAEALPRE